MADRGGTIGVAGGREAGKVSAFFLRLRNAVPVVMAEKSSSGQQALRCPMVSGRLGAGRSREKAHGLVSSHCRGVKYV